MFAHNILCMESGRVVVPISHKTEKPGNANGAGTVRFRTNVRTCQSRIHQPCPLEDLRRSGFERIRAVVAGIVVCKDKEGVTYFDRFQQEIGRTDAVARMLASLPRFIPGTERAEKILDITCATGNITLVLMDLLSANGDSKVRPTIIANDISAFVEVATPRISRKMRQLGEERTRIEVRTATKDPTDPKSIDYFGKETCDVIYWTAVNIPGDRGKLMGNAYEMLKPGGWFCAPGSYPWEPIPARYVGIDGYSKLATLSRPTDMNGDLKEWVLREWIQRASELGVTITPRDIEILVLPSQQFGSTTTERRPEVRCIAFRKPE